ncbi:FHA domain-containing protein [Methyloprofundus sp.]|uniref:FHA domain-containing protein n=1 Tax=Methyloprofundus sp. TaxID=2020875 RepID=UPI003D09F2F7
MSKFDTDPTVLSSKKTKKLSPSGNRLSQENTGNSSTDSAAETIKLDKNQSVAGNPKGNHLENFRDESGAMGGANLNEPSVENSSVTQKAGNKTIFINRSSVSSDTAEKPIVGWLVIISGKGKGHSFSFSYLRHKIGRDSGQDIALAFGDEKISRENHASIEFDPKLRKYYLMKGENLVYLNDGRVGSEDKEIQMGDKITLGDTDLRFVPFCGEDFDWKD